MTNLGHFLSSTVTARRRAFRVLATAALMVAATAHAQFGSSLTGTVADASGGAIPNATVTLTNEATNVAVTKTSSATGVFAFPSIGGGRYDLSVTAAGFKVATYMPSW